MFRLLLLYRSLTAIALLCLPFVLQAQESSYQFNKLDIGNGLSHNQVNAILKDDRGFMWFGTMSGLNRYDGYEFKVFQHSSDTSSINDNYVAQVVQGPEGKLWVSTRAGWNIYDPSKEKFNRNAAAYLRSLGLPESGLTDIKKTGNGNFLFLYPARGFYYFDAKTKKTRSFEADRKRLQSASISSANQNSRGEIWVVYTDGVLEKLDARNFKVVHRTTLIPAGATQTYDFRMFLDAQDDLWFYILNNSDKGVFYFNTVTNSLTQFKKEEGPARLNNNLINGITQDEKGLIWIATDHGGINILDKKSNTIRYLINNPQDEKSIAQNSVYSVYKDNTGIIWVGTYKRGISYFHENFIRFPLYKHKPSVAGSLPYDDVNRFVEDAKGNLWIGTNGGGLIYFDRSNGKFTQYRHNPSDPNSLSNDVIVSLCIDHQQKLWIGTFFGGLNMFDGERFVHYRHDETDTTTIADNRIWEIYEDSQKRLWVGTLASGLDLLDREKNVFIHHRPGMPNSIHASYISSIIEDRSGNMWFGTAYGVDVLLKSSGKFINYLNDDNNKHSLSNNNVISLLEDSRGSIWIGTRDGLNLLNKDRTSFTVFTTEDGLPANAILTILEDDKHQIWVSTPKGLSNITKVQAPGGTTAFQFRNYDEKDGLQGKEFNESAALKTRKGELVFGGPNGFNLFYPKDAGGKKDRVNIVFTDFQLFNKTIPVDRALKGRVILHQSITEAEGLELRYNQDVFSIAFAALDFPDAEKIKYAYKLEGFNDDWLITDAGNRKATFTNLDPGGYTFKVRIANPDGSLGEEEASLKITVLPPFWQTPLAYVLYFLAAAGILFGARHLILRRAKMRFALEQERKEAQRLHELDLLKITFFTNISHEFRTPLSLILAPLDKIIKNATENDAKKQLTLIQRNAKRLLNLVNLLLDFRRMEVQEFRLVPSEGDIILFIKDLACSFSDIAEKKHILLSFHASVGGLVTRFDKDKMEKIVFNLLSNAFRFTQNGGKITVSVEVEDGQEEQEKTLVLNVADTGIGIPKEDQEKIFERFFQHATPGNIVNQGSGLGLAITKEFVKLFNGTISVESEPENGSCFTVTMPVKIIAAGNVTAPPLTEEIRTGESEDVAAKNDDKKPRRPTILLVEDNEDFRFYLKDNLKAQYNVVEAVDGKEGWKKVNELQPELVVSDIMMPRMNGLELSRKIKNDPRTSHIPIVLLTAMASEEQQLEGFESGANDYITKPFSFEILLSRVKSLLKQRKLMRKAFQQQLEVNPSEITVTPVDEQFIKNALEIVEANLSDAGFSVEDFSRSMHMSRVALYKKLVSITGRPPLEFIRSIRMKRAAQLLLKTEKSVSEVAYEVGFNNPKYFTRYFKEEFNVLPSQYASKVPDSPGKSA